MCETETDPEKTGGKQFPKLCVIENNLANTRLELGFSLNLCTTLHFPPSGWSTSAAYFHLKIYLCNVFPLSSFFSPSWFSGLRKGNEILSLNGEAVSDLDITQMEVLFSDKSVGLTLVSRQADTRATLCASWSDSDLFSRDQKGLPPSPNQSQLLEEFLDNLRKTSMSGKAMFRVCRCLSRPADTASLQSQTAALIARPDCINDF